MTIASGDPIGRQDAAPPLRRVRSFVRRAEAIGAGAIVLTVDTTLLGWRPRDLDLLPRELKLLEYLMRRPGQVVTRAMMFEEVWNYRFTPKSNLIDVHLGRLRKKLEPLDAVKTLRNAGYTLALQRQR